jgi:serine-threonine kinase receptor-associated protein
VIITKCCWVYKSQVILVATSDGKLRFWAVPESKLLLTLEVEGEVRDIEYSSHLQVLTVAASDIVTFFRIDIRDTEENPSLVSVQGKLLHAHKMPIHFRAEGGASLHPSGKKFIAGGSDLWVRVFDFLTGEELECHKGHHGPIRCLRYSPDGDNYASGSEDGTIRLWKVDTSS